MDPRADPPAGRGGPAPDRDGPLGRRWLERLALHRPELRAWALYDWANSGFVTVIITTVFPIYFGRIASNDVAPQKATERFAWITTASLTAVALASPILGALADASALKKRFLVAFMALGVAATAAMFTIHPGQWVWAGLLFGLANVGVVGSFVFYDALLVHVARPDELDRLSSAGYALGYVGGGLLLFLDLLVIQHPERFGLAGASTDATLPTRLAFVSVAVWWVLFSIPLLRTVREPARRSGRALQERGRTMGAWRSALREVLRSLRDLARWPQTLGMLLAFLIYNDGIGTIIRMAALYGGELGLDSGAMIRAILLVQVVGIPCSFAFGALAGRIGAKRSILLGIGAYFLITLVAWRMHSERDFYLLALLVGTVQGGVQALSRSLYASLIPAERSGEFFGLFSILEKFAGVLGPLFFALASRSFGSSRAGLLAVVVFFAVGGALLWRVDVEAGQRAVRSEPPRKARPEP